MPSKEDLPFVLEALEGGADSIRLNKVLYHSKDLDKIKNPHMINRPKPKSKPSRIKVALDSDE